jgi:hypothetical protein
MNATFQVKKTFTWFGGGDICRAQYIDGQTITPNPTWACSSSRLYNPG